MKAVIEYNMLTAVCNDVTQDFICKTDIYRLRISAGSAPGKTILVEFIRNHHKLNAHHQEFINP